MFTKKCPMAILVSVLCLALIASAPARCEETDPLKVAAHQYADDDFKAARKTLLEYLPGTTGLNHALTLLHIGDCDFKLRKFSRASAECAAAVKELNAQKVPSALRVDSLAALGVAQFDAKQYDESLATFSEITKSGDSSMNPLVRGWALLAESASLKALEREADSAEKKKEAMQSFRDNLFNPHAARRTTLPELSLGHRLWWRLTPHVAASPVALWRPADKPRAIVLAVHGLGLNKEAFAGFAEEFKKRKVETVAMDVRGFGAWKNLPGTARTVSFGDAIDDIKSALEIIREHNPNVPVYLLGESMGGALVIAASGDAKIQGVISSVPAAERYGEISRAGRIAIHYLLDRDQDIDIAGIAEDAEKNDEIRRRWLRDPHARLRISPLELRRFSAFMKSVERDAAAAPHPPILMTQGASDRLVKQKATIDLFNRINCPDKNLVLLGHTEHLIFEYSTPVKTLADSVDAWITNHPLTEATSSP